MIPYQTNYKKFDEVLEKQKAYLIEKIGLNIYFLLKEECERRGYNEESFYKGQVSPPQDQDPFP